MAHHQIVSIEKKDDMATKSVQTFLNVEDEAEFSKILSAEFPNICFLDGSVWDKEPITKSSIDECASNQCYIWNKDFVSEFQPMIRKDGKVQGPQSGFVFQLCRSRITAENSLWTGSLGIGYDKSDDNFHKYVLKVFKLLTKVTVKGVHPVTEYNRIINFEIKNNKYFTGKATFDALNSGELRVLQHYKNYFLPIGIEA